MKDKEKDELINKLQDNLCFYKRKWENYQDRIMEYENNMKKFIENIMFDYVCDKWKSLRDTNCSEFLEYLTQWQFQLKNTKYIDQETLSLKSMFDGW